RDLTTSHPSSLVLQLDIENAFNSVERIAFFNALTNTPLAPLIPFTRSFYATPSQLLTDPRLSITALTSARGVRQGDPLGPLLFAASIQQHLRRVATEHPEVTVLAYADDITLIGPATATLDALKVLTPLLAQDGLTCSLRKSSAWSSSPIEGSPVGSQRFCADLVRSTLTDAAAPLGSLASIHPQHTLLLLSRCISRRIGYLLRTTPADALPLTEWHTWCAELLNTALTSASIQPPRHDTEFNFLLRQATLPVALGGLGLTDPTTEAAPAYLASTAEALRLLRSLDLPGTSALGSNSNALQPSAAHSVTIQDMEGRLPPLALQILRGEQESPSQDQLQCAELAAKLRFNAAPTSYEAAKLLTETIREDRHSPAPVARSPLYPPAQDRDPRSDPLRPIPLPPTPAHRQRASDVATDPPTRRAGAARGRETRGIRVGRGSIRRGCRRGATTQRRGASSFARAAQRVLRQRAREGGETLGDDSGNGSAGDPSFIPEREGSSSPSTEEEEVDPAQGVGEIPTGGRTASAIRTPRNRAARGNRAATNTEVTTTPNALAPIVSADDLAGRQDLFADIANWDLCPLRDSRQPPLARHPPRPLRESFAICLWRDLHDEAAGAVTNNPQPRHVPDTTGKLARAEGLAKRGNLAISLQSLTATPVCMPSAEVLRALTVRRPEATLAITDWVHYFASKTVTSIAARDFRRLLARCPNGVGAGPSGTTFEHLRDAALGLAAVLVHLHALTNTELAGKLSAEAADLLTASRLLAFSKPQGGTRTIAVGECLLRLIAKAALFLAAPAAREHFIPLQFGVVIAGGIEAAIHTARTYLEEFLGATALQIDLANVFNAVERAAVFEGLKGTTLDFLVPLVRLSYGRSSALYLDHEFWSRATSERSRRGELHGGLHSPHRGPPQPRLGSQPGEAWSATALDPATLPPAIKISLDGVRVLGSPIGPPIGCAARVRERLSAAAEPLPLLSPMDPQLCLLLLTRRVSRRASFLVRATPLEALPLGEWSAWGEDLLHTYLASALTTIPRDRAKRDRIWQQAALPASLGGLGITNPAVEGGFAYLASVVSAAHLLRSFDDSANPALTGLLPLMDADEESTSLLPRRLAALEAELPPDEIEAL
ncbi:unnamed protein product, partial [Closterium sp. NIES-54]